MERALMVDVRNRQRPCPAEGSEVKNTAKNPPVYFAWSASAVVGLTALNVQTLNHGTMTDEMHREPIVAVRMHLQLAQRPSRSGWAVRFDRARVCWAFMQS